jgi:hypothetical protein
MSIKLLVLKTGETVIADVLEWLNGPGEDAKLIGYLLKKPCLATLKDSPDSDDMYKINLFPWIPLSKDTDVPIPTDYVVTMVEPIEKLVEIYKRDVYDVSPEEETPTQSDVNYQQELVPTIITPDGIIQND